MSHDIVSEQMSLIGQKGELSEVEEATDVARS